MLTTRSPAPELPSLRDRRRQSLLGARAWLCPPPAWGGTARPLPAAGTPLYFLCAFLVSLGDAFAEVKYQQPPKHILDVLRAPLPPSGLVSPTRDAMLLITYVPYKPISDLSQPYLRLAGVRLLPRSRRGSFRSVIPSSAS